MKWVVIIFVLTVSGIVRSQSHLQLDTIQPAGEFDNVSVKKIGEDSLQSVFIIWVKKDVKGHFHQEHTESIVVLEGKAEMLLGEKKITIKKGDYLIIPKGTKHSVNQIIGRKTLKVLSIQAPNFDGTDRIFTTE